MPLIALSSLFISIQRQPNAIRYSFCEFGLSVGGMDVDLQRRA